ncbi:MAG: glycosyltransferase family 2 protein [Parvularculaceae bacterium]
MSDWHPVLTCEISIIIVNFNAGDRLAKCLECLQKQTFTDFEVIIVDNASSDNSLDHGRHTELSVKIIEQAQNIGFAAANNRAADQANGRWLAFLNPDAYAQPDWLAQMMAAARRYPEVAAFGSTQLDAVDPTRIDGAGDVYHALGIPYRGQFGRSIDQLPPDGECLAPCAAAAFYKAETFAALEGFDERFFCYSEDVDLGFRLHLAGGTSIQLAKAIVHHEGSGISGRYSAFSIYHGHRNRIWMSYKNLPGLLYLLLFPIQLLVNLTFWARALVSGTGGPYWRAMVDGYRGLGQFSSSRRSIQANRCLSPGQVAELITWSPVAFVRRQGKLRPIRAVREPGLN